ncbi:hypothetical protein HK096_003473, partial [Nowakowskiella sp. JEL0078]
MQSNIFVTRLQLFVVVCILNLSALPTSVLYVRAQDANVTLPDFNAKYPFKITLTNFQSSPLSQSGSYSFYWRVQNQTSNNATIELALALSDISIPNSTYGSWMGIGFGKAMFDATFVVIHSAVQNNTPTIYLHEHQSDNRYSQLPKIVEIENYITKLTNSGITTDGTFFAEFTRPASGGPSVYQPLISAVYDDSLKQDFIWAFNQKSPMDFKNSGNYFTEHGPNTDQQRTHGILTFSWSAGTYMVGSVQTITVRMIHGIGMMSVWFIFFPFGLYFARYLKYVPGIAQSFIGLYTVHQIENPAYLALWVTCVSIPGIVFLILVGSEIKLYLRYFTTSKLEQEIIAGKIDTYEQFDPEETHQMLETSTENEVKPSRVKVVDRELIEKTEKELTLDKIKQFTWKSLDDAVRNEGKIYVVGNGRFVYDATQWINSHPGGHAILYSAAGTAGFDTSEFTPTIRWSTKSRERIAARESHNQTSTITLGPNRTSPNADSFRSISELTETDWQSIQKARRTHKHTRAGVERLSKIVIGEITNSSSTNIHQYQRYTIAEKYTTPVLFEAGQSVEIQVAVKKKIYSKFYTPTNGTMTAFDVFIKNYVNSEGEGIGVISSFLAKQKPGQSQIKIRGPFGEHMVRNSQILLSPRVKDPIPPNQIVFVAAGSGVTPAFS